MFKWEGEELKIQIGIIFKLHRLRKKLSQFQVGNEVNLTKDYIGIIERGKANPTIEVLIDICNFLDVDINLLVTKATSGQLEAFKLEIFKLDESFKNQNKRKS